MKAVWYEQNGPAREVLAEGTMPDPRPGPGEVRVRVEASAVNPSDIKGRSGWAGTRPMAYARVIPHQDAAGVIDMVGDGAEEAAADVGAWREGQRVWVREAQFGRPFGTAAEFVVVPAACAAPLPERVTFIAGACLGIPATTAHRCLFADGPIAGQTVLVTGGAGGVGFAAVQLAAWAGARVIATVSRREQAELALSGGADAVIDRTTEDVAEQVRALTNAKDGRGIDRIIDVDFAANWELATTVLKRSGVVATYGAGQDPRVRIDLPYYPFMLNGITIRTVLTYIMPLAAKQEAVLEIGAALVQGALRPHPIRRFPLTAAGVASAHELVESGRLMGKAVIEID